MFCQAAAVFLSACLFSSVNSFGQTTNRWTNAVSSVWHSTTNWSAAALPSTSFNYILVTNTGTKTVTIDSATAAANLSVSNLTVSAPSGFTNTLFMSNLAAEFTTSKQVNIGLRGALRITNSTFTASDTFDVSAGTLTIDSGLLDTTPFDVDIRVGRTSGATGTVLLNGGTINCFGFKLGALGTSTGNCTIAGGTLLSSSVLSAGEIVNAPGNLTLVSGQIIATNDITKIGNLATGTFNQSGGTSSFAFFSIGDNAPGTANISGGQVMVTPFNAADITRVGNFGDAQLNISGGTVWLRGEFHMADNPGVNGTVLMTGGQLFATNARVAIGRYGIGAMTVTNSTAWFTNTSVGRHADATGTLTVQNGGSIFCIDDISIGRFASSIGYVIVSGGLLSLANDNVWVGREGIGDLAVSSGTVRAKSMFVGMSGDGISTPQGAVTLTGGTTLLSSNIIVGTSLLCTGQVSVLGGNLFVTNSAGVGSINVVNGSFSLNQGAVTTDQLSLTNSGRFNFIRGTLQAKSAVVSNGLPFVVGDGVQSATLNLQGGVFTFNNGLVVSSNATLTGCGTVIGAITNYGTISTTNCGGGASAPSISQQPVNQMVAQGGTFAFSVTASGTAPLSYQWRLAGTNLSGATASAYSKTNAQTSDGGSYSVFITNSVGSITSAVATLTVVVPPSITAQPQSQTATQGGSFSFTVTASGSNPLAYQWRLGGANVSGATSSAYSKTNAQPADAGNYSVVITNFAGSITSSTVSLHMVVRPTLRVLDWNGTNSTISFTSVVGLVYTLEYKNALTAAVWTAISPSTNGTGATILLRDSSALVPTRLYRARVD